MILNNHYLILCGSFICSQENLDNIARQGQLWFNRLSSIEETKSYYGYIRSNYYNSFKEVAFSGEENLLDKQISGTSADKQAEEYQDFLKNKSILRHITLPIPAGNYSVNYKNFQTQETKPIHFAVDFIDIYLYPDGIGIFTVKTHLTSNNESINFWHLYSDFSSVIRLINTTISLDSKVYKNIYELLNIGTINQEHDFNTKLKMYSVIEKEQNDNAGNSVVDELLFELGTASKINIVKSDDFMAPSEDYYNHIISENKISVFKNWTALALFDSFTVLVDQPKRTDGIGEPLFITKNFEKYYFPVYINNLYLKYELYKINYEMSRNKEDSNLRNKYIELINRYYITNISYNFLPNEINTKILQALDIHDEIDFMQNKIETISRYIEEQSERESNRILNFLSVISVISAVWDGMSFWDRLANPKDDIYVPVSLIVSSTVAILIISLYFRRKNKIRRIVRG